MKRTPRLAFVAFLTITSLTGCEPQALNTEADRAYDVFRRDNAAHPAANTLREGTIQTTAGSYHYVALGSGPTVLLYHGFPSFWYAWKNVIPVLAEHFRVVAIDGLGANRSAKPADLSAYRVPALAGQLMEIIHELSPEDPVHLVGHDWGAALVWSYAQAYPENVASLTTISAPPLNLFLTLLATDSDQQRASRYVERLKALAASEKIPETGAARLTALGYGKLLEANLINQADYDAFGLGLSTPNHLRSTMNWYAANIPAPNEIQLENVWPATEATAQVPSLLIWGLDDGAFVGRFTDLAHQYAEPIQIERLPDTGHWPMFEAQERTNQLLKDFLLKHSETALNH